MTDDTSTPKPGALLRGLFIASLSVLFGELCVLLLIASRFKVTYEQLGMTELPWLTSVAITLSNAAGIVLPIAALALLLAGALALRKANRRTVKKMTVINFIVSGLLPGYVVLAIFMPLIEIQKKLSEGS